MTAGSGHALRPPVAFCPAGGPGTASSRLRAFLPANYLRRVGWRADVLRGAERERALGYPLVVFQKAYDQASLDLVRRLRERGARTVFDLCDNHWHYRLDQPQELLERSARLDRMIDAVDLVTTSTPALQSVIEAHSGRRAVVIDDAFERPPGWPWWRVWGRLRSRAAPRRLRLVWFGSSGLEQPPHGLVDVPRLFDELRAIADHRSTSLTVISNSRPLFDRHLRDCPIPVHYLAWSPRRFPWQFVGHDICVLPISRNALTDCKTANRPLLSLALGVPVVADAIPSYRELAGFTYLSRWREGLERYAESPSTRHDHVTMGRRLIREKYTPRRIAGHWSEALLLALDPCSARAERSRP